MPLSILPYPHEAAVVTEALQITVEPSRNIIATPLHESDLFVGYDELLKHLNLLSDQFSKPWRIDTLVTIRKTVLYVRTRKIVNNRGTHRELIQIVVCEMIYDPAHERMSEINI